MESIQVVTLFLLLLVAAASALSRLLRVPYPILLVIGGSLVGFVPGMPRLELAPDVVLFVFLPPLLYHAAYSSSVRDLRQDARAITLTAIGLVLATTTLVAVVAHAAVPGIPWAAAFALGAVVSPTDPLAATQITQRLGVPRRMTVVIEGEALVNDGSALVLVQAAVAAAGGAAFEFWRAGGEFVYAVVAGVAIGVVVALVMTAVFRRAGEDELLRVVLSLTCGYLAYLPAEEVGASGVLAAVAAGLVMSNRAPYISTSGSRLHDSAFWDVLVFLLNAVLFIFVALQLPEVLAAQDRSAGTLAGLGILVSGTAVLTRLVWVHTVPYVVRALDRRESQRARHVGWRIRTVTGWCGLRGAVSLAAALGLPLGLPERDLIVFLTLCVIWATLVGQGLTLPLVIRALGVEDDGVTAREELHARKAATKTALAELARLGEQEWTRDDTIERLRGAYEFRRRRLLQRAGVAEGEDAEARSRDFQRIVRSVIGAQRREVVRLRDQGQIGNDALLAVQRELDLEEQRLDS